MDLDSSYLSPYVCVCLEGVQLEDCHLLASGTQWRSMAVEGTRHKVHPDIHSAQRRPLSMINWSTDNAPLPIGTRCTCLSVIHLVLGPFLFLMTRGWSVWCVVQIGAFLSSTPVGQSILALTTQPGVVLTGNPQDPSYPHMLICKSKAPLKSIMWSNLAMD
jgi:hypothetical protein